MRDVLTDDIAWHVPGENAIAGDYHGIDEVLAYFARRRDLADRTFRMHPRDILTGDGDTVAALTDGTATSTGSSVTPGRPSGCTGSARTGSRSAGAVVGLELGLAAGVAAGLTPRRGRRGAARRVRAASPGARAGRAGAPCACFGARSTGGRARGRAHARCSPPPSPRCRSLPGGDARHRRLAGGRARRRAGSRSPALGGRGARARARGRRAAAAPRPAAARWRSPSEGPPLGAPRRARALRRRSRRRASPSPSSPPTAARVPRAGARGRGARAATRCSPSRSSTRRATPTSGARSTSPAARTRSRSTATGPCSPRARSTASPARERRRDRRAARAGGGAACLSAGALTERARGARRSRRGFLARVGRGAARRRGRRRRVAAPSSPATPRPTTSAATPTRPARCPHPTGLPRVDRRGFPLRARDGQPVDDLGRRDRRQGQPVDERRHGCCATPTAGRCPPAPRTPVCDGGRPSATASRTQHRRLLVPLLRRPRAQARWTAAATRAARINGDARADRLLLRGPQGLLRHVLPDEGAVLSARWPSPLASRPSLAGADRRVVAVRLLDGRDARRRAATPARAGRAACATFALGALARRRRSRSAAWPLLGARSARRRRRRSPAAAARSRWPPRRSREARGRASSPQIRRQVPEPWRRVLPLPLAAGALRRAARARLHDLRAHARRLGARRRSRRARRPGARAS